ncbi:hypothetical protein PV08_04056 [Exophiala spinifera]|uniref:Heterokaryon incompatibility domain-containing protein n=1 Tax=Exophiala spinifera TaxID=91928 RepID=A0A0D1YNZ8_9EURO|nr:uncharacterized protein PV08_04056 [Exophiala spinifera]KIW16866.1 hypothetical protein PV08_04056 [Exophiala spinifera]
MPLWRLGLPIRWPTVTTPGPSRHRTSRRGSINEKDSYLDSDEDERVVTTPGPSRHRINWRRRTRENAPSLNSDEDERGPRLSRHKTNRYRCINTIIPRENDPHLDSNEYERIVTISRRHRRRLRANHRLSTRENDACLIPDEYYEIAPTPRHSRHRNDRRRSINTIVTCDNDPFSGSEEGLTSDLPAAENDKSSLPKWQSFFSFLRRLGHRREENSDENARLLDDEDADTSAQVPTHDESLYRALDRKTKEIRLLEIHPAQDPGTIISCNLRTVSLTNDRTSYDALSYAWGDRSAQRLIRINGELMSVKETLYTALRCLRESQRVRTLWIDALCINQDDLDERGHQVRTMKEIYEHAATTRVWLGTETIENDLAFDTLAYLGSAGSGVNHLPDHIIHGLQHLIIFKELLQREWWSRVWVLQEVVLAKEVVFHCGNRLLPMDILIRTYHVLQNSRNNGLLHALDNFESEEGLADFVATMSRGLDPIRNLTRFYQRPSHMSSEFDFILLLAKCRENNATDPRDKIYGLLGLAPPWVTELIEPSYDRSHKHLYTRTALQLMSKLNSSILFNQAGLSSRTATNEVIPSWVPDWSQQGNQWVDIELRLQQEKLFDASGYQLVLLPIHDDGVLMRGLPVDIVIATSDKMPSHCRHPEARACFARWESFSCTGLSSRNFRDQADGMYTESYWQTVLNGALPSNEQAKLRRLRFRDHEIFAEWRRRSQWRATQLESSQTLQSTDLLDEYISSTTRNRRLFMTAGGKLGIGPAGTKRGDYLYLLAGATHPCLLRQVKYRLDLYQLVGECYVHGIMNGEATKMAMTSTAPVSIAGLKKITNVRRRPTKTHGDECFERWIWNHYFAVFERRRSRVRRITLTRSSYEIGGGRYPDLSVLLARDLEVYEQEWCECPPVADDTEQSWRSVVLY